MRMKLVDCVGCLCVVCGVVVVYYDCCVFCG